MNRCEVCEQPIEIERLTLPGGPKTTCFKCANQVADKVVGFQIYGHKTAGEVQVLKNPTPEQLRQARRAYERSR